MPGFTPVLGIPYPLLNETVDPAIFQQFATTVSAAIQLNQTNAQYELTGKPTYRAQYTTALNPAIGPNITPNLTFAAPFVDNNTFFSGGAPTRATINTAGVYLVQYQLNIAGASTHTKTYIDLLYNGVQILGAATIHGFSVEVDNNLTVVWPLSVTDFLQFRWSWQGTGTAFPFNVNVNLQWLCPLV